MRILRNIDELKDVPSPVHLAIGVFDGVHLGHLAVIGDAMAAAKTSGGSVCVVTFDPHPVRVLAPQAAPRLLTAERHKEQILAELGIHSMLVIPFDEQFARKTGEEFIRELIDHCSELRQIAVGSDFEFGHQRSGNVALLDSLAADYGFTVTALDQVLVKGERVSSTAVRRAVEAGDLAKAATFLGRDYTVLGTVIEGRQLGRTIGFPTANLTVHSEQLPPNGVWAVTVQLGERSLKGVANLGVRPTVEGGEVKKLLEVHLFDFQEDLYGKEMTVRFDRFIREEKKFASIDELKEQIAMDAVNARKLYMKN